MNYLKYICRITAIGLLSCMVAIAISCQDDQLYNSQTEGIEGAPTVLSLSVNLNEMKGASRAAIDDTKAGNIKNLWVGIYNVKTGERTYSNLFTEGLTSNLTDHGNVSLPSIATKSGKSYIVAVANVPDNYGIADNEELRQAAKDEIGDGTNQFEKSHGGPLSILLDKADTWEKYKSISFMLTVPTNVDFSASDNLVMSGSYHNDKQTDPASWYDDESGNPKSVDIPAASGETPVELPGCIHLRRMISYVKFNIVAGTNVTVEPVSWRVYNNPVIAYLQERPTNAADESAYFAERVGDYADYYKTNHGISNLSYDFDDGALTDATGGEITGNPTGFWFDFYQFENKQTAIGYQDLGNGDYIGINSNSNRSPYADREREWKTETDETDEAGNAYKENTGIYKSLSADATDVNTKNFASYVTFRLKVTYWVITNEDIIGKETPVAPNTEGAIRREGYANYTVHLGYIEGDEASKATDFNCRRNMKYTYNVTVNSLNNIIVEAFKDGENQPGAEGDVTDVQNVGRIDLDAHYAVFNIQLSYAERKALQWMIEAPYNDVNYSYYSADYREDGVHAGTSLDNNQFYTWIRFKPTTDEGTLRVYNDRGNGNEDLIGWTLEELADPENHKGVNANGDEVDYDENPTEQLWYTVFIDEYVYHRDQNGNSTYVEDADRGGTVEGGWWAYVNQEPRIVWIACNNRNISADRESMYLNSKYMISQNSILTYYSSNTDKTTPDNTALGMERENETFGLNLAWSNTAWNALNTVNADNGRYNVWYYLTGGNINNTTSADGRGWSSVAKTDTKSIAGNTVTYCTPFSRSAIDTPQLRESEGKTARVFMPGSIAVNNIFDNRNTYNPFPSGDSYDVITACMSRNRDENGNGVIDVNEMKWYVPTTGKYARIILGRAVIPQSQRLMNFDITPAYGFNGNDVSSDNNTRHHFASSDKKVVWAEEGTSTSDWHQSNWDYGAWEIRCVRNLGVNMGRVIETDPVTQAYTYDNNQFTLAYYADGCKRAPVSTSLPVHDVQSETNQPAYQFEVATARCNSTNTTGIAEAADLTLDANGTLSGYTATLWSAACNNNYICGRYSQEAGGADRGTWRVPNQKELVMMRREGLLPGIANSDGYLSCTQEHYTVTGSTEKRFFYFFPNRGTVKVEGNIHVRCVRDILNN